MYKLLFGKQKSHEPTQESRNQAKIPKILEPYVCQHLEN